MTTTPTTTPTTTLGMLSIDCADAAVAADFWSGLMGWEVVMSGDGYAMLAAGDGLRVGFGSVPDYRAPAWPNDGTKQFHLDLACSDLGATEAQAVELGATVVEDQPGDTWRVLIDPSGHPFCLTDAAAWG